MALCLVRVYFLFLKFIIEALLSPKKTGQERDFSFSLHFKCSFAYYPHSKWMLVLVLVEPYTCRSYKVVLNDRKMVTQRCMTSTAYI